MASVYVHIPFCARKCSYCDFVSFAGSADSIDGYISALLQEAEQYKGERAETLFIGGGTPSLLSCAQMSRLMRGLRGCFVFAPDCEITAEANPNSLDAEKLRLYSEEGINRLSMGLQSTLQEELTVLGRLHTYEDFLRAYESTVKYFDNINIDLISGLPGQTPEDFAVTLERVAELRPQHISAYSLIIEPGTPLSKKIESGLLSMPDEETDRRIYRQTAEVLSRFGYRRYEISNYALPGRECRHNMVYWTGGDYIGLGCAAHSLYHGVRSEHTCMLQQYIDNPVKTNSFTLTPDDLYEEYIMLRLRLTDGFSLDEFAAKFGFRLEEHRKKELEWLTSNGFVSLEGGRCRLTRDGLDVCQTIIAKLI